MKGLRVILTVAFGMLLVAGCAKQAVEEEPVQEQTQQKQEETVQAQEVQTPAAETEVTLQEKPGQVEEVLEVVAEGDSVDVFYMVKPNDYLSKIAKNEYGNMAMWKMIYKWNRKKIGSDPNMIYPFHEFLLKKPKDVAEPLEYDFYSYTVKGSETLWSIAGKEYDNNYAWIVILRDNADTIGSDLNNLEAGMVLKLRTQVFN